MTEIPNPGGWFAVGNAINNRGHVAGTLTGGGDLTRAFFWSPETGTVVLPLPPGHNGMQGIGLNEFDVVAGEASRTSGGWSGFVWDGATYEIIPPPDWANGVSAFAINNSGVVVGTVSNSQTGRVHAFSWENGVLTDLGDRPEFSSSSSARDVSDVGRIVGRAYRESFDYQHAFGLNHDMQWFFEPPEVAHGSEARAANENGFIVGYGLVSSSVYGAAVWTPTSTYVMVPPPRPTFRQQARLFGVNNAGRAVGSIYGLWGTVWQNGTLQYLEDLVQPPLFGDTIREAMDINDFGQILARITGVAVILTPVWLPGDLTGDCRVTIEDLILVLSNFGMPPETYPRGDADLDGEVGLADLALVLSHWGR